MTQSTRLRKERNGFVESCCGSSTMWFDENDVILTAITRRHSVTNETCLTRIWPPPRQLQGTCSSALLSLAGLLHASFWEIGSKWLNGRLLNTTPTHQDRQRNNRGDQQDYETEHNCAQAQRSGHFKLPIPTIHSKLQRSRAWAI